MAGRQHQPPPVHSHVLPRCHHAPSTCSSSACHPELLPPAALPCPQSLYSPLLSLRPCHCLLCLYNPPITSLTLPQLSDPLLQALRLPRSCLHVSLFLTLNKPILPKANVFPHLQDKSFSQPLNHPQAAASTLLFKGKLQKTSHCQQIIVTQRFLIMCLPLPFFCPSVCRAGPVCIAAGAVVHCVSLGTARL